jgi:4'-phosphopantetheinyl transferase
MCIYDCTTQSCALSPAEIHLWLAIGAHVTDKQLSEYEGSLSPAEKGQAGRFYFATDRRRYVLTRALVRTVLSQYAAVAPRDWSFSTNAWGRPEIVNSEAAECGLSFNLSHTRDLVVMALAKRRSLGVDVEQPHAREANLELARHYFAPQEVEELAALPAGERAQRFFEYWTFKEAYIKARGMGLALPLDKFSLCYPDAHSVKLSIDPDLADQPARWQLWQLRLRAGYLIALCAERVRERTKLVIRQGLAAQRAEDFPIEVLRYSDSAL